MFGVLRPLNRAVKFRLPGQSGDSTALRLAASSKLRRTAYELLDSVQSRKKPLSSREYPNQTVKPLRLRIQLRIATAAKPSQLRTQRSVSELPDSA